jgi:hypothetical protein
MSIREERFLARNPRNGKVEISRGPTDGTPVEPGGDPGGTVRQKKPQLETGQRAEKAFMCQTWTTR